MNGEGSTVSRVSELLETLKLWNRTSKMRKAATTESSKIPSSKIGTALIPLHTSTKNSTIYYHRFNTITSVTKKYKWTKKERVNFKSM